MKKKRKIIDGHLHIYACENEGIPFLDGFDEYIEKMGISTVNIAALPSGKKRNVSNNIWAAFYKLANKKSYAHAGFIYPEYPAPSKMPYGMDLVSQYKELMEIGFDGIKMLEGKPTLHKIIGKDLSCDLFDAFYSEIEKDGVHLLFHVNDPDDCWDRSKVSQDVIDSGWFYGEGNYASHEEIYSQIERVLEKHPKLNVTFAHFFFLSKRPEKLIDYFEKYPNMDIDITPGGEMYDSFNANPEYYREFFIKYSKRIQLGTDVAFPFDNDWNCFIMDVVNRYLTTNEEIIGFNDNLY